MACWGITGGLVKLADSGLARNGGERRLGELDVRLTWGKSVQNARWVRDLVLSGVGRGKIYRSGCMCGGRP
ncbi:hypothetical protein MalM25_12470 [Planctomycetes bacterium MalM25]|nr:hypothetical protein MalM25_12470 [Planctomycetes bacterium MalM25]